MYSRLHDCLSSFDLLVTFTFSPLDRRVSVQRLENGLPSQESRLLSNVKPLADGAPVRTDGYLIMNPEMTSNLKHGHSQFV